MHAFIGSTHESLLVVTPLLEHFDLLVTAQTLVSNQFRRRLEFSGICQGRPPSFLDFSKTDYRLIGGRVNECYAGADSEHTARDLIAYFDADILESLVETIAAKSPLRPLFCDGCFTTDAGNINVEQVFKQMTPSSRLKAGYF